MTTILVAVPRVKVEQFKTGYLGYLIELRRNEYESWKKRAEAMMQAAIHAAQDKEMQREISEKEFNDQN